MIPPVGTLIPREAIQLRHVKWQEWINRWTFARHSHELTGPYAAVLDSYTGPETSAAESKILDSYLVPHEKETPSEYQRRVREARCPRFVAQGISSMVGVLSQRSARRDGYPEQVRDWLDWVDSSGSTWDLFVQNSILPLLLRYGIVYVLPHRPALTSAVNEAQREASGLPSVILDVVSPEALVAWETDEFGRLAWARYYEEISLPAGPLAAPTMVRRYWTIDGQGWWAVDDSPDLVEYQEIQTPSGTAVAERLEVVDAGRWDGAEAATDGQGLFLAAPLAPIFFEGWHSPTEIASLAQLEYYRTASELRKIESSSAFSMLAVPILGSADRPAEMVKGPDQVLTYPSDSKNAPSVLSPDTGPFEHYRQRLADLKVESLLPYGVMGADGVSSGIALAQVEHQSSHLYRVASRALSQGEYAVMELVATLLGTEMPADVRAEWPTEFGALSSTKQVEDLLRVQDLTGNPEVKIELACKAVDIVLPDLTDDRRNEIRESIEESVRADAEAAADMQRMAEEAAANPPEDDEEDMAEEAPPAAGGGGATTLSVQAIDSDPSGEA